MMALPIGFEISFILHLWLGKDVPEYTSNFVILLFVANTIGTLQMPVSTMVQASGKMKFYQILSSFSNLMTVPLAYLFIKIYDYPPIVYLSLIFTTITTLAVGLLSACRYARLNIKEYCNNVILPGFLVILITFPFGFVADCLMSEGWIKFLFQLSFCPSVIIAFSYLIALNSGERRFVNNIFDKLKSKA